LVAQRLGSASITPKTNDLQKEIPELDDNKVFQTAVKQKEQSMMKQNAQSYASTTSRDGVKGAVSDCNSNDNNCGANATESHQSRCCSSIWVAVG
jgi:hypothetical protein